jgi:hypothetical protein
VFAQLHVENGNAGNTCNSAQTTPFDVPIMHLPAARFRTEETICPLSMKFSALLADPILRSLSNFGGKNMRFTHRYISSLILAAALVSPVAIMAAPVPKDDNVQVRVYDRDHKDYHNWDDHENSTWGIYLSNNHKKPQEYKKASRKEQSHYWGWRHSHPD